MSASDDLHALSNDDLWSVLGELRAKRDEVIAQVEAAYDRPMDLVQKELDSRDWPRQKMRRVK